jgi:hypothetical protein
MLTEQTEGRRGGDERATEEGKGDTAAAAVAVGAEVERTSGDAMAVANFTERVSE